MVLDPAVAAEVVAVEVSGLLLAASASNVGNRDTGRTAASMPPRSVRIPRLGCSRIRKSSGNVANSVSLQYSILSCVSSGVCNSSSLKCVQPVISSD
jgi:hypothetical protein